MQIPPQILYLAVCLFVGWLGDGSRFGFWGSFLGALFLTPVIAMMALLLVAKAEARSAAANDA